MEVYLDPNANNYLVKFVENLTELSNTTNVSSTTNIGLVDINNNSAIVTTDSSNTKNIAINFIKSPIIISTLDLILTAEEDNLITPIIAQSLCVKTSTSSADFQSYKNSNKRRVAKKFLKIFNTYHINSRDKFEKLFKNIFNNV